MTVESHDGLSSVGTKVSRIYLGVIITGLILAFFVPSATARIACLAPIIIGIVENLGIERKSRVAALLMVGAIQVDTFWNIMIQTAAAQNLVAVGFMQTQMKSAVSWIDWLTTAAPFSIIMVIIYILLNTSSYKTRIQKSSSVVMYSSQNA